jgi:hypothetical protein
MNANFQFSLRSMAKVLSLCLAISFLFAACKPTNPNWRKDIGSSQPLHKATVALTEVIMHDVFNPPQASRIYAYSMVAGYEAAIANNPSYKSFAHQLSQLEDIPKPEGDIANELASVTAYLETAKGLVFSPKTLDAELKKLQAQYEAKGVPSDVYDRSIEYGKKVSAHILAWMKKDNYKQTRSMPKFTVRKEDGRWIPTPPAYKDGVEPNWMKVRPFALDSAAQFIPVRPPAFMPEAQEVYNITKSLTEEQKAIANFWDDNGFALQLQGHAMFSVKKITPGGHWMYIVKSAAQKAHTDFTQTAQLYALTSVAVADAFVACWDEKYRSNRIRPETAINQSIDPNWQPLLQTPPFPEYPSGHSTITSAAATTLTHVLGASFAFTDSTETQFGLGTRSFPSFFAAAEEAGISRVYGGIHYNSANEAGKTLGKKVGEYLLSKLNTKR